MLEALLLKYANWANLRQFSENTHASFSRSQACRTPKRFDGKTSRPQHVQTPSPKHVSTCCVVRPWYMYVVGEGFCCQNMHGWKRAISHPLLFHFCLVLWNTKNSSSTLFAILCRPSLFATLQKPRSGSIATCGPTSRLRNVPAKGRWKSLNLLDKMVRKVAR